MSYKSGKSENPVGPEAPSYTFPFSKVHVLVALLVLAIGLTAWKQYEANTLAPQTPIHWQSFSVEALEKAAYRRVDVLIVIDPVDWKELQHLNGRITSPEFQKAVYIARPSCFRIESLSSLDEASADWLNDKVGNVSPGMILWLPHGDRLNHATFGTAEFDKLYSLLNSAD